MAIHSLPSKVEILVFDALREANELSTEFFDERLCKEIGYKLLRELKVAQRQNGRRPRGDTASKILAIREYLVAWSTFHKNDIYEGAMARFNQLMTDLEALASEVSELVSEDQKS
jgi:hypothetical protein